MATMAQFVPTEVPLDLDVPQREAAFFYGLFLRGHSPEQLRRDIEVPPAVLAKWHREAEREPELRDIFSRIVEYRPTYSLSLTLSLAGMASSSASNKFHPKSTGDHLKRPVPRNRSKTVRQPYFEFRLLTFPGVPSVT